MEQPQTILNELSVLLQQDPMLALIRMLEHADGIFMRIDGLALISHLSMKLPALYDEAMKFCSRCGTCCSEQGCVALRVENENRKERLNCDIYTREGVPISAEELSIWKDRSRAEDERLSLLEQVAKGRSRPMECRVYNPLHSVHNEVRDPTGLHLLDPMMLKIFDARRMECIGNFHRAAVAARVPTTSQRLIIFLNGGSK